MWTINPECTEQINRLASDVIIKAVRDLVGRDPVMRVDALLWFIAGGERVYLDSLDLDTSGLELLCKCNVRDLREGVKRWPRMKAGY